MPKRQKMSKTKGNVMDPIEIIEKYGTDAVRFTLAAMAAPGDDIAFSESRTESYRAFANKIWNAARFLFMNVDKAQEAGLWSLAEFKSVPKFGCPILPRRGGWAKAVKGYLRLQSRDSGRPLDPFPLQSRRAGNPRRAGHLPLPRSRARGLSLFLGRVLRLVSGADQAAAAVRTIAKQARTAYANLISIFEGALRMLSPFMPFITEELWHAVYDGKPPAKSIALVAISAGRSGADGRRR